jgi:hypothetical protein
MSLQPRGPRWTSTEAWNAYTCADPEETRALLERIYEKSDAGRAGTHETSL